MKLKKVYKKPEIVNLKAWGKHSIVVTQNNQIVYLVIALFMPKANYYIDIYDSQLSL